MAEDGDSENENVAEHCLIINNEEEFETHQEVFSYVLRRALPEILGSRPEEDSDDNLWGIVVAALPDSTHANLGPKVDTDAFYGELQGLMVDAYSQTLESWPLKGPDDLLSLGDDFSSLIRSSPLPPPPGDGDATGLVPDDMGLRLTSSWLIALLVAMAKNDDRHRLLALQSCSLKAPHAHLVGKMLDTNRTITRLYLDDNEVCHGGVEGLRLILAPPPGLPDSLLVELSLVSNGLNADAGEVLGEALGKTGCPLKILNLSDNYLGAPGAVAILEGLSSNPDSYLAKLDLSDNTIGDADEALVERIVDAVHSRPDSLGEIDVSVNGISDCERLAEAFPAGLVTEAEVTCTVTYSSD